jgi:hypothetical protein
VYKGQTWEQRLQQREAKRQLLHTHDFLVERAWQEEDEVFADIAGKKKRKRKQVGEDGSSVIDHSLSRAREASCCCLFDVFCEGMK